MADVLLDTQGAPSTLSAGQAVLYVDNVSKALFVRDDAGLYRGWLGRASVAAQGAGFASDTYLTNSGLIVPGFGMQAGMTFLWRIAASKTAAGVATPIIQVRIGALQTTGDTSRLTLTGPAQTAAVDAGILTVRLTVRSVGGAGVLQGNINWSHNGAAAGFANNDAGSVDATSAGFANDALGGLFVGLSINGGAAAAWTVTQVQGEMGC